MNTDSNKPAMFSKSRDFIFVAVVMIPVCLLANYFFNQEQARLSTTTPTTQVPPAVVAESPMTTPPPPTDSNGNAPEYYTPGCYYIEMTPADPRDYSCITTKPSD